MATGLDIIEAQAAFEAGKRSETYPEQIRRITGREIEVSTARCEMCINGANGWEDPCTACGGDGEIELYVFVTCRHSAENDCCDEECKEAA